MSRLVFTVELAAAAAATIYILAGTVQTPDHPEFNAAELAVGALLAFAGFLAPVALCQA